MEYVYTGQINELSAKSVDAHVLAEAGLVSSAHVRIKLLAKGDVTRAISVHLQGASANASEAVTKAGGSVTIVAQVGRPARTDDKVGRKTSKPVKPSAKTDK
jgi:large subunit ribosomal protein L15